MKRLIAIALLSLPLPAAADYLDVIAFELNEGCSFGKFMEIVADFNEWGKRYGYQAEVAMPLQNDDLTTMYWLGRTADAATYGKAWDTWRDALPDASSAPARLWARFQECSTNTGRYGYDIY